MLPQKKAGYIYLMCLALRNPDRYYRTLSPFKRYDATINQTHRMEQIIEKARHAMAHSTAVYLR